MGERIGLSDEEWSLTGPLLPAERGLGCSPAANTWPFFEGMLRVARTSAQWRHLPEEYGKWNSVFRRYHSWATIGVFDAMLEALANAIECDGRADMIDSTVVRAHHCAVGIKGTGAAEWLGRSATASPPNSMPVAMSEVARSPSC
ncbi:transposase [Sphingomonas sp. T9W2]|uniref:transposase n=1 Tax=Sphingomonas sp. T9W2 TaxID=3143183 RepID=UPI0031F50592